MSLKDKHWPQPQDTLADWDKAAGQAALPEAERIGMEQLMERKGGRFVAGGDFRAATTESESTRKRHILLKNAEAGAAIADMEGEGFTTGQAIRTIDPKRGSRARTLG